MSRNDEYRANAAECQRMASVTRNPVDKQTWLEMAQHWMHLIKIRQTSEEKFDQAERARGTHQAKSKESH